MNISIRLILALIFALQFNISSGNANSTVKTSHNYGFFSCCSMRLYAILGYFNEHKQLPQFVDSSESFGWYKPEGRKGYDITYDYFEKNTTDRISFSRSIDYDCWSDQFSDYKKLNYNVLHPFLKKYFTPTPEILTIIEFLEDKYNVIDYKNICVLFYRGNDKITETNLCSYSEIIEKARIIQTENPDITFLIQSDETEFIESMTQEFPNSFYFEDEIRHMKKNNCGQVDIMDLGSKDRNYLFSKYYLAITIIMSKCNSIVCGSGNCSIWIMFYRNNANNVYQYLNGKWFTPIPKMEKENTPKKGNRKRRARNE